MDIITYIIVGIMLVFSGIQGALLCSCLKKCGRIDDPEQTDMKNLCHDLNRNYIVFSNFISLYPLLGMLGTVLSLITMNGSGDMQQLRSSFFTALITTAAGLVFAIVFKIIHSVYEARIEEHLQKAERLAEEDDYEEA